MSGSLAGQHTAINLGPDPPDALQELSPQRRLGASKEIRPVTPSCEVTAKCYVFPKKNIKRCSFDVNYKLPHRDFETWPGGFGTQDSHMDQLRTIFHHAIFGTGHHSSPPTAGFIEFLQIMSCSVLTVSTTVGDSWAQAIHLGQIDT